MKLPTLEVVVASAMIFVLGACSEPTADRPKADMAKIMEACASGDLKTVATEFDKSNDYAKVVNEIGPQVDYTPIHVAAYKGHLDIVRYLALKGVSVDLRDRYRATPLMSAAGEGHVEVVRALLSLGADANATDGSNSPLTLAAIAGHTDVARILVDGGASVNREGIPMSPLHAAAVKGHRETVQLLLQRGADVDRYDVKLAANEGHKEVAQMLRKAFIARYHIDPDLANQGIVKFR